MGEGWSGSVIPCYENCNTEKSAEKVCIFWTAATETAVLTVENKARSGQRLLDFRHCYLVVQPNPFV